MQNFLIAIMLVSFFVFSPVVQELRANHGVKHQLKHDANVSYNEDKDIVFFNSTKKVGIKTVLMGKMYGTYDFPIVSLEHGEQVQLLFDDLNEEDVQYHYEVIHCTWDWKLSGLEPFQYTYGIIGGVLFDYENSFNTTVPYRHYRLTLPNDEVSLTISGNYVVRIYEERDGKQRTVLTRRFALAENLVSIEGRVKRPVGTPWPDREQALIFHVNLNNYSYYNAFEDFRVVVLQNDNWRSSRTDFTPSHLDGRRLVYDREVDQVFPGLNEFRYFATRNFRTPVANVEEIRFDPALRQYRLDIFPDEGRPFTRYRQQDDINGAFRIDTRDKHDVHLRADYAHVHLSLVYAVPFQEPVCVMSALYDFGCGEENRMEYNFHNKRYEASLFLKQGYYDYLYGVASADGVDMTMIEGSHYQTENVYTLLFYDRSSSERYNRLIGLQSIRAVF